MGLLKKSESVKPLKTAARGGSGGTVSALRPAQVQKLAPCIEECPAGNDVRGWLNTISQQTKVGKSLDDELDQAFRQLVSRNPLPSVLGRVCPHPCEGECNRKDKDSPRLVKGYGRIPLINSVTCPTITKINGMDVVAGSPLELLACIRAVELVRAALRRAQRPGLPIMNSIATAVTAAGKITGSAFGLRNTDAWVCGFTSPMQVQFERLNEVAYLQARGGQIVGESGEIMGGYAGGPAGTAVINIAYHIFSILLLRSSCHLTFPIDFRYASNTSQEVMWAVSTSTQAITRNSHHPMMNLFYVAAGPMTEMCLYEIAAVNIGSVASGGAVNHIPADLLSSSVYASLSHTH